MDIYLESRPQRELPPSGMHRAVCVTVATMGTQVTGFGPKPQVLFQFELLDVVNSSGKPFCVTADLYGHSRPDGSAAAGYRRLDWARSAGR